MVPKESNQRLILSLSIRLICLQLFILKLHDLLAELHEVTVDCFFCLKFLKIVVEVWKLLLLVC